MRNWFSSNSPDRAHAAVAEVIDVVDFADVAAQLQQVTNGGVEVVGGEGALIESRGVFGAMDLDVELHPADAREVVLARVEEHPLEQLGSSLEGRRIAGRSLR